MPIRRRVTLNLLAEHAAALEAIAKFRSCTVTAALQSVLEAHLGDHRQAAESEYKTRTARMYGASDSTDPETERLLRELED